MVNSVPGMRFEFRRWPDAHAVQLLHIAVFIAGEVRGGDAPIADAAFFMRAFHAQLHGPERPGRVRQRAHPAASASVRIGDGAALCRWHVPRQSAPVSPPPMMTTRLPGGENLVRHLIALADFILSAAGNPSRKWMPFSSRPGTFRSRGSCAPPESRMASKSCADRPTRRSRRRAGSPGTRRPPLPSAASADREDVSPS